MNSKSTLIATFVLAALAAQFAAASETSIYTEQGKLIRAPEAIGSMGPDLLGDKINFYTGKLEFTQTDVSLQGNNGLPVQVARRFSAAAREGYGGGIFEDWDLDIPNLHGVFAFPGWSVASGQSVPSYNRCSSYGPPPPYYYQGAQWAPTEYWHGTFLHVPGGGDQELLRGSATKPNDGQVYPASTKSQWVVKCLPNVANDSVGEGFLAIAPDGTQYKFDWIASRPYPQVNKSSFLAVTAMAPRNLEITMGIASSVTMFLGALVAQPFIARSEIFLFPTLVTDRFGNTVTYTYDPADPWKLLSIQSSDGRALTFTYVANTHRVQSVTDGSRTWTYAYGPGTYHSQYALTSVTLPDASKWQFSLNALLDAKINSNGDGDCYTPSSYAPDTASGSITHPSGATGSFTVVATTHGRSYVQHQCQIVDGGSGATANFYAFSSASFSITNKTISGPGLPTMSWTFDYSPFEFSYDDSPCAATQSCAETKVTTVTDPRNDVSRYTFGNRFQVNEGLLLKTELGVSGGGALKTITVRNRPPLPAYDTGPYPQAAGASQQTRGDGYMATLYTPEDQRIITQQGVDFKWEVAAGAAGFDSLARPIRVTKSSSLGMSRTEQTVYVDNFSNYVLGQVQSMTDVGTGKMMVANTYDPVTANLLTASHFGKLDETNIWNADGTLATRKDGLNQTTTFSNYKRGIAQNATYADGTTESAVVNNIGLLDSVTDLVGKTTSYGYDAMGRLAQITRPAGDAVAWNTTSLVFEPVVAAEYGIPMGHWRQTVTTGNAKTIQYFDAFWRPLLTRPYDTASESSTARLTLRKFDFAGHTTFESYPQRSVAAVTDTPVGTTTVYDALGRATQKYSDSELGILTTAYNYLPNFQKQVVDPRGNASTTSYQAFDEPSEKAPLNITAPEGVTVAIARDIFGKAQSITRSGTYLGGPISATRSYVYDGYERLCKTIEPEVGATIQDYDAANNVLWRATGLGLTSTASCDTANAPASSKTTFTYDARNRLKNSIFADGSPSIMRTYTADGLPETVNSGGSAWTYTYNNRRLLKTESVTISAP